VSFDSEVRFGARGNCGANFGFAALVFVRWHYCLIAAVSRRATNLHGFAIRTKLSADKIA